jgi:hypothetical protein
MTLERDAPAVIGLSPWHWVLIASVLLALAGRASCLRWGWVINRYRTGTASFDYFGDSIIMLIHPFYAIRQWQAGPPMI